PTRQIACQVGARESEGGGATRCREAEVVEQVEPLNQLRAVVADDQDGGDPKVDRAQLCQKVGELGEVREAKQPDDDRKADDSGDKYPRPQQPLDYRGAPSSTITSRPPP